MPVISDHPITVEESVKHTLGELRKALETGNLLLETLPEEKPELVIAGNYRQYQQYILWQHKIPEQARYIHEVTQLYGLRLEDYKIQYVGTWEDSIKARECQRYINYMLPKNNP